MTNNFSVFAEQSDNIMTEEEYREDSARINGVQSGVASSALHNTSMFQVSAMTKAIADMVEENGYDVDYTDPDGLSESLKNFDKNIIFYYDSPITVEYVSSSSLIQPGEIYDKENIIPINILQSKMKNKNFIITSIYKYPIERGTGETTWSIPSMMLFLDSANTILFSLDMSFYYLYDFEHSWLHFSQRMFLRCDKEGLYNILRLLPGTRASGGMSFGDVVNASGGLVNLDFSDVKKIAFCFSGTSYPRPTSSIVFPTPKISIVTF